MEDDNQNSSPANGEEKSYENSLEENRRRIISGEAKPDGAGLDPGNEIKQGEKEKLIAPAKSGAAGNNHAVDENIAEKENIAADGISGGSKPRIETTLPPKELLDERESEFNKSEIENREIKNEGMKERMASFQNKKSRKPIIWGLALGLLIVVILAGLYFFGGRIFKKEDPRQIIKSSLETMNDIKSYNFAGDFNLDFVGDQDEEENFSLAMKFDGQADESNPDNIKSSFNIKPEITISKEGGSEDISLDFSIKSFGKVGEEKLYLKLGDFDLGAAGMIFGEMIIPYKNKWYSLDMKELREISGSSTEEDFNPEEMIEKIKELSKKYEMIKFQEDLGDTKIGDVGVYHYQVGIDSEALFDFYAELSKTLPSSGFADSESIEDFEAEIAENKEEILAVMDEVLTNIKTEIWIGKEDGMIRKIKVGGKFDQEFMERLEKKIREIEKEKHPELYNESEEKSMVSVSNNMGELSFNMSMIMSNFNQPVEIVEPEEAEDLMEVLEEAMAGLMGGMVTPPTITVSPDLDSDGDGLTDVMEDFYRTDKNNPDTDGDGYLDGDEVENGYDPLAPGSAKLDYGKMFE